MKAALLVLVAMAGSAHAESKADKLFAKGKKLLAQKKYDEVEISAPGFGTLTNTLVVQAL